MYGWFYKGNHATLTKGFTMARTTDMTGNIAQPGDTIRLTMPTLYVYNGDTVDERERSCRIILDSLVYEGFIPATHTTLEQASIVASILSMKALNEKQRRMVDIESLLGGLCRAFNLDVKVWVQASDGTVRHTIYARA